MHYIYVLRSLIVDRIYVGFSSDLKERFRTHNLGKVRSTKAYKPWILIYYEAYKDKLHATKREKQLKMHAVKKELLIRLGIEAK